MGVAIVLLLFVAGLGFAWTKEKSVKRKRIVWGLLLMFAIGPLFSWLIGIGYGAAVGDGFAGMGMMILLLGIFLIIGLILMIMGFFTKNSELE